MRHSYLDAFSFTKKVVACWSWRRFRGCLWKVKQVSMDFIFIREKAALGWIFLQRVVIIPRPISLIRNTQEICRRYWRVRGNAYLSVKTDRFSVSDVIGRTVVVHSNPDDFHSQPAGNAGTKIACGVICNRTHHLCHGEIGSLTTGTN